ncbi:hypothetical protein Tco_0066609 [Tanacetum coccineum]
MTCRMKPFSLATLEVVQTILAFPRVLDDMETSQLKSLHGPNLCGTQPVVVVVINKSFGNTSINLSTNPNTTIKIVVERNTDPSLPTWVFQRIYICLGALKLGFRACRRDLLGLDGAFMKGPFPGQVLVVCLGDDIDLHPNLNFTFISDRQKGIIPAIKTVYPTASATNVRDFEKCMLELKTMNPKAHEWLNKIPAEHWARSHFSGRAKSDLLLNNICEVFNGKIVGGRDKPVITLLEYIREYCMKRIVNVQGVIDKCTGPLTPTATRIMESIKKEAHLMKVQWNGANKYQVSGSLGDHLLEYDSEMGKSLLLVEYMEGNILSQDTTNLWDQVLGEVHMSNNTFATQASCLGKEEPLHVNHAETLDTIRQHAKDKVERQQQVATMQKPMVVHLGKHNKQNLQLVKMVQFSSPVSETRNEDGKEMGDGVPTQSSAAGGVSEWSFL